MANHKKNRPPYRSNYNGYRSNYSSPYHKRKNQEDDTILFMRRFIRQGMVCLCLLMGVLLLQKMPNTSIYDNVKTALTGSFPFSKYDQMYKEAFLSMFPFEFSWKQNGTSDDTTTVSGLEGSTLDEEGNVITEGEGTSTNPIFDMSQAISDMYNNMVLKDFENGVIIQIKQDEEIRSFFPGVVLNVGMDEKISNFMEIQLDDESILTVGFIENRKVSKYEHIKIGDVLGVGSIIAEPGTDFGDHAYYYLSLKDKEGSYQDIATYLEEYLQ